MTHPAYAFIGILYLLTGLALVRPQPRVLTGLHHSLFQCILFLAPIVVLTILSLEPIPASELNLQAILSDRSLIVFLTLMVVFAVSIFKLSYVHIWIPNIQKEHLMTLLERVLKKHGTHYETLDPQHFTLPEQGRDIWIRYRFNQGLLYFKPALDKQAFESFLQDLKDDIQASAIPSAFPVITTVLVFMGLALLVLGTQ